MTPEPRPGVRNSPGASPGPRRPKNWSKNSLKNGSSADPGGPVGGRRGRAIWTVPTCTTAGRTRPATVTNASCSASAVDKGDGAAATGGRAIAPDHKAWPQKPAPATATRATTIRDVLAVLGVMKGSHSIGTPRGRCQIDAAPPVLDGAGTRWGQ